jgi:hypothetical protein
MDGGQSQNPQVLVGKIPAGEDNGDAIWAPHCPNPGTRVMPILTLLGLPRGLDSRT